MSNVLFQKEDLVTVMEGALINNESPANESIIGDNVTTNADLINPVLYTTTYAAVTVTTAQLADLSSNPIELLAAPGAGYIYVIHGVGLSIDEGGTEFNEDFQYQLMSVIYNTESMPTVAFTMGSFFLDYTESRFTYANINMSNAGHAYVYNSECVNKSMLLYPSSTFTATGGTTRLRVHLWYTIIEASF